MFCVAERKGNLPKEAALNALRRLSNPFHPLFIRPCPERGLPAAFTRRARRQRLYCARQSLARQLKEPVAKRAVHHHVAQEWARLHHHSGSPLHLSHRTAKPIACTGGEEGKAKPYYDRNPPFERPCSTCMHNVMHWRGITGGFVRSRLPKSGSGSGSPILLAIPQRLPSSHPPARPFTRQHATSPGVDERTLSQAVAHGVEGQTAWARGRVEFTPTPLARPPARAAPLMLGDCSGPGGGAIIAAPRDPSEAPADVEGDPPAPAAAPTALIMRRLGSARDLVRLGRKLSRHGFDIGEQVTEKGSTVVAEVNDPTTALPQHVPTETAPLNSLRSTATFRLAHNTGP